jgi:hypothetical protein
MTPSKNPPPDKPILATLRTRCGCTRKVFLDWLRPAYFVPLEPYKMNFIEASLGIPDPPPHVQQRVFELYRTTPVSRPLGYDNKQDDDNPYQLAEYREVLR